MIRSRTIHFMSASSQACSVYINTLLIQEILSDPYGAMTGTQKTTEHYLTFHSHFNPYPGTFLLDFSKAPNDRY